jgi:hypothetical protein
MYTDDDILTYTQSGSEVELHYMNHTCMDFHQNTIH